jgi:DNA repair protein RadC
MPEHAQKPAADTPPAPPHYHGHRDRLRARFLENPASLPDYELLELLLFAIIPQQDVKPLAKQLIAELGSFAAVLNADVDTLTKFPRITDKGAATLKATAEAARRIIRADVMNKPVLNSWDRLLDYCHASMAHNTREELRLLFLNKKNELIADEVQQTGTVDHTPAYPREILKRALELGATALIMVHNHPSGDPKPSKDDIALTHEVIAAARTFDIVLHDHLVIARKAHFSFRNQGLI